MTLDSLKIAWATRPMQRRADGPRWLDYAVAIIAFTAFMLVALNIKGDYDAQQCFHFKPMMTAMRECEDAGGAVRADLCRMPLNATQEVFKYGTNVST